MGCRCTKGPEHAKVWPDEEQSPEGRLKVLPEAMRRLEEPGPLEPRDFLNLVQGKGSWDARDLFRLSSPAVRSDRKSALAAVQKHGTALSYAADHLKADKEVVLAAVAQDGCALQYVDKHAAMWSEKEFVLSMVQLNGNAIEYVDKQAPMWEEKEFVLSMVKLNGPSLKYAKGGLTQDAECLKFASPTIKTCAAEPFSFEAILTQLFNVHKHELEAVTKGIERTRSDSLPTIYELARALVTQHETEVQAARVRLPASLQRPEDEWVTDVDATSQPLWHIGDPCLPKRGGPEQKELEQLAEARREKNDVSNKATASIKEEIQEQEAAMLKILNELKSSSWGPIEIDIRKRVCRHVQAMENGDFKLACVRKEQLSNIEQIRVAKVEIWKMQCHADNNETILDMEFALRSRNNKLDKLETTERRLREDEESLEEDMTTSTQRLRDLVSQRPQLEGKFGTSQDDVWKVTYEEHDAHIQIWKNTFEMQALTWKQSHARDKQLCMIEDRWKLLHVHTMLRRQEDAERASRIGDHSAVESLCARLEDLTASIQNEAVSTKAKIAEILQQATEAQTKLRTFKHVHTVESDKVRDNFLFLTFTIMVEDVRLAWLRKEQLQAVDLTGMLRRALAESEGLHMTPQLTPN